MPLATTTSDGGRRARTHAPRAFAVLALAALLAPADDAPAGTSPATLRACASSRRAGPDSTAIAGGLQIGLDRGLAQTFVATDTLVRSISVWLPAGSRRLSFPLHVYVTRAGADGRPRPLEIVADAGTVRDGGGRGVQPARFLYEFSPPLSLPEPGAYAIVVTCDECGIVSPLTAPGDAMRDGRLWEVGRRGCMDPATSVRGEVDGRDLLYEVVYCDRGTDAFGRTWGEIKTLYR